VRVRVRLAPRHRLWLPALVGVALLAAGCGDDRPLPPKPPRPVAVRPDAIPDIPLPSGWLPVPDEDHIAFAIGGGTVRRLDLRIQAPPSRDDLEPEEAIARHVAGVLPDTGWQREKGQSEPKSRDRTQAWRKGAERLVVTTERDGGLAVLRYVLEPVAP
jgi:hypothetical protein